MSESEREYLVGDLISMEYRGRFTNGLAGLLKGEIQLDMTINLLSGRQVTYTLGGLAEYYKKDFRRVRRYFDIGDRVYFQSEAIANGSFRAEGHPTLIGKYSQEVDGEHQDIPEGLKE